MSFTTVVHWEILVCTHKLTPWNYGIFLAFQILVLNVAVDDFINSG